MYTLSIAIDVNPPGAAPVLGRDDVWRGLVMKAENALPFVPAMQACTVVERSEHGLVREVLVRGERFIERVTFTPQVEVRFRREERSGATAGWITNVISDSDHGLLLTFTFSVAHGGEEMKASYVEAIKATLGAMRRMVLEGSPR